MSPRPLGELLSDEDAWPEIEAWAADAENEVVIRPARVEDGERTLLDLQITTRSPMGAVARHAEGILVDHGWIRVLGAGGPDVRPTLAGLEGTRTDGLARDDGLLVAHDAIGGFFAVNGGGLPGERGETVFLSPRTLRWHPLEAGYEEWLRWLFDGDLADFYDGLRWDGWEREAAELTPGDGLHLYPPPWSEEGADVAAASRRAVPVTELWALAQQHRSELDVE